MLASCCGISSSSFHSVNFVCVYIYMYVELCVCHYHFFVYSLCFFSNLFKWLKLTISFVVVEFLYIIFISVVVPMICLKCTHLWKLTDGSGWALGSMQWTKALLKYAARVHKIVWFLSILVWCWCCCSFTVACKGQDVIPSTQTEKKNTVKITVKTQLE